MEATEDIALHNKALEDEYAAEIEARKVGMRAGLYRPRFCLSQRRNDATGELERWDFEKHHNDPEWVNWDLEMSMEPGRRLDVTKGSGLPSEAPPPVPSQEQIAREKEARLLRIAIERNENAAEMGDLLIDHGVLKSAFIHEQEVSRRALGMMTDRTIQLMREEKKHKPAPTVAQLVGSRQQILDACGGNEAEAEKVIAKACATFGVTSLDEPITKAPTSPSAFL